jgi:hypothetical protein
VPLLQFLSDLALPDNVYLVLTLSKNAYLDRELLRCLFYILQSDIAVICSHVSVIATGLCFRLTCWLCRMMQKQNLT